MRQLPAYLQKKSTAIEAGALSNATDPYRPLVAGWLIEMALCLGWYRKRRPHCLPEIFSDDEFVAATEIAVPGERDEDGDVATAVVRRTSDADFARCLKRRLVAVRKLPVGADLPLFRNVELLAQILGLGETEKAVLTFIGALNAIQSFRGAVSSRCAAMSNPTLFSLMASVLGRTEGEIQAAVREDAPLVASGVIKLEADRRDLEDKISLMPGLDLVLLLPQLSEADLFQRFLKRAGTTLLDVAAFPHLARDVEAIVAYLRGVLGASAPGCNVLFYGPPGTGKTELVKAIAAALGADLYEIAFADTDGNPIKGAERLRAFNMCQKMLAQRSNSILMFDEIEDVFAARNPLWFLLGGSSKAGASSGKAWINRTLERNSTPSIWITNDPNIDPAYLRRFDYSVRFPIPPLAVRLTICQRYLGEFEPSPEWLARIAANEHVSPGQLEAAAKVARLAAQGNPARARALVEQALDRSATLLDQKRAPTRVALRTGYDLRYLNVDIDVARVVAGLTARPRGTFCLYGPAGTGKSELARHLADAIGKPLLVRRASDLLGMYVGETERNIATMFADARQQDAVLVPPAATQNPPVMATSKSPS